MNVETASDGIKLDVALQLLAVFVNRLGGEVVISQKEYEMMEGVQLLAKHLTPEHLLLRLPECDCEECNPRS
jgi:hypothetical protein